ncbi:hypothetical protein Aph02nite_25510 [Actinoplanes philippinensis]|uniref:Uncharacterized protein n=1 Tax=Actinoplanes philippinensis TaxID=35752 RepID=A0A1I2G5C2_9ACTN|nr:hypothetical protein [Actinoplanes philippinensis]GIE76601.1 hypothetical protein Aph02nite_25510 [Actinoplanes philippinensis]SFF12368.1 hypothetical protein SAMN05421541_106208 [Actinoplanes philippinensis]
MARLTEIAFCLPATPLSEKFISDLRTLLADVAYATSSPTDSLTLTPPAPSAALPVTVFRLVDRSAPEVTLDIGRTIGVLGSDLVPDRDRVELADLAERLAGSVKRIDHTGVNLPAQVVLTQEWDCLVQDIAASAAMYRYPGEPWPFVLPSTGMELENDIHDFVVGREPRFELVHDTWNPYTTWQIALWTTLTRTELEQLFPDPVGIAIPGLEEFFRTVFVQHSWPNLEIRFDLCFRVDDGPSDWETGEWLVTQGGRIR